MAKKPDLPLKVIGLPNPLAVAQGFSMSASTFTNTRVLPLMGFTLYLVAISRAVERASRYLGTQGLPEMSTWSGVFFAGLSFLPLPLPFTGLPLPLPLPP